jgi:uncharacterized protein YecT (DUF1311 family)
MRSKTELALMIALVTICHPSMGYAGDINNSGHESDNGYSQKYMSCIKSANSNVLSADACMSSELAYQDARLNKVYNELLQNLKPASKEALIEAERIWVQLRAKDGAFEASIYGSSQSGNAQQLKNDLQRVTERANLLEGYLELAKLL